MTPTFDHEKLTEAYGYAFFVETLRQWMIADCLWRSEQRKQARVHPRRLRCSCLGELAQSEATRLMTASKGEENGAS